VLFYVIISVFFRGFRGHFAFVHAANPTAAGAAKLLRHDSVVGNRIDIDRRFGVRQDHRPEVEMQAP
jgi:hypothetical protein